MAGKHSLDKKTTRRKNIDKEKKELNKTKVSVDTKVTRETKVSDKEKLVKEEKTKKASEVKKSSVRIDSTKNTSSKKDTKVSRKKTKSDKKKIGLTRILIIMLVIIVTLVGLYYAAQYVMLNIKVNKVKQIDIDTSSLDATDSIPEYRSIVIFTIDKNDSILGKANRSDSIIIASINDKNNEVKIINVSRDTFMQIEEHDLDKVSNAYAYGDATLAIKTLNNNLDLNIKEFVTFDFDLISEIIDDLGGIEINVKTLEAQYVNAYLDITNSIDSTKTSKKIHSGKQLLDGGQAIAYSRIRSHEIRDDKEIDRMQIVISALMNKLNEKNPLEKDKILDKICTKMITNLPANDIKDFTRKLNKFEIKDNVSWPYEGDGVTLDKWYYLPNSLEDNVEKLHKEIYNQEDYEIKDNIKKIQEAITKSIHKSE